MQRFEDPYETMLGPVMSSARLGCGEIATGFETIFYLKGISNERDV